LKKGADESIMWIILKVAAKYTEKKDSLNRGCKSKKLGNKLTKKSTRNTLFWWYF
jgi:hypothetical protein